MENKFSPYSQKYKQQVCHDLSLCVLSLLVEVSVLPSLEAISFVKVEILIFQTVKWTPVGHVIKGLCGLSQGSEPLTVSQHLARVRLIFLRSCCENLSFRNLMLGE